MAYDDYLKLRTWSLDGSRTEHITEKVIAKTWSGSYKDCSRKLTFEVLPDALTELGGMVRLYLGPEILFSGHVRRRQRVTSEQRVSCTAYDRGIFLKKNFVYRAVRKQTPEAVTAQLCGEFGIPCGALAATGVPLDRNFLGSSLYQVIQTLYTLAAEQTGKKYQIRFRSNHLEVVEKAAVGLVRLEPGVNLISCTAADSTEDLLTSVAIYSDDFKVQETVDSPARPLYGLMQQAIKASSSEDPKKTAGEILKDHGLTTTIHCECLGDTRLITGNAVTVHEPETGLDGLFWITADSHSTPHGIYKTSLTLDFRDLMDSQSAGSKPK